ncbi:MAG TPA: hypothetical protein VGF67_14345 [Ktedonobacteraceae bacterium]
MSICIFLLYIVRRLTAHGGLLCLVATLLPGGALVSACSGPFAGGPATTPTPALQTLSHIGWCAQPVMVFRDEGAVSAVPTAIATGTPTPAGTATATVGPGAPRTLSDWPTVRANLGFTLYLPANLPNGSCLVSAQATIHDPIFGGSFTIGYLLPDHSSLSLSEAPLKSQNTAFLCNPTGPLTTPPTAGAGKSTPGAATPTATPGQLCSGAKATTNIVLSGPGSARSLQQIFNSLQANVNWIPA